MYQEGLLFSDQIKEDGMEMNGYPDQESKLKIKKKSSKKKKKQQKLRMEQLSSVYSMSNSSFTPRSSAKNKNLQINTAQSPRVGHSLPGSRRKLNGITLLSQRSMLNEQTYEGVSNLYSTFDAIKVSQIFQQEKYISKSTRNFDIPQSMKKQVEQNKLRVSQERYVEYEKKLSEGHFQDMQQQECQLPNRKSSKKMNGNLSVIQSNTPSTSSEVNNREETSDKSQLSPLSQINREVVGNKNGFDLYTANSHLIQSTRNKSQTQQQPIYNALFSKHRSLSFNQENNSNKNTNYKTNYNMSQGNQAEQSHAHEINLQLSDSINGNSNKNNNWEEEFIGLVQDQEKDTSNKSSLYESTFLRQSISKKEERNGSKLSKFSMDNISFSNQENIERLKKKLTFKPREFIPLGTKYSFQSQDADGSVYFKSISQIPKVINYKIKQFNEGKRETSPNLQKKISKRFFDKYQNNSLHVQGSNESQTQDFDIDKVKEKTVQIKKSTQQLSFFPWRLNQIMQEKEKQEQERKMNRFEFESNNQSHKLPPQKQQQELDIRFQNLMQNMDMKKQLEEINRMINKQKQIVRKDSEQIPKTVRFVHQTSVNYDVQQ